MSLLFGLITLGAVLFVSGMFKQINFVKDNCIETNNNSNVCKVAASKVCSDEYFDEKGITNCILRLLNASDKDKKQHLSAQS